MTKDQFAPQLPAFDQFLYQASTYLYMLEAVDFVRDDSVRRSALNTAVAAIEKVFPCTPSFAFRNREISDLLDSHKRRPVNVGRFWNSWNHAW
jgi:hypothetical protein